ncbi:MAG: 4Fe-4S binding protein [Desulfovibrionales bacterium]|nr:4Fe-4S binding protein [Desulfovibrionales bacterium]
MIKTLKEAVSGVWSMLVGLKVTGINFFQPQVTVHYPRQTAPLEGYRGHIELVAKDSDPYESKCVACGTCALLCPSQCISMKIDKSGLPQKTHRAVHPDMKELPLDLRHIHPEKMDKKPRQFHLDFNYCSLCGLCVQNCPSKALRFSSDVYLAGL